ncbi:hypothetical protein EON76_03150 [bacterium]|nr:MAG: hypothetical protein EON76_03150 [bacterium]
MKKDSTMQIRRLLKRYRSLIVSVVILIISSLAVFMYLQYQNSPQKIVYDAVLGAVQSPQLTVGGTIAAPTTDTDNVIVATMNGQLTQTKSHFVVSSISNPQLNGEMITDRDDTFLKINRASELAISTAPQRQADLYASIVPRIKQTIDDRWIWIEQSDVALVGSIVKLSGCSIDIVQSITKSSASRKALLDLYKSHPFFVVSEDGVSNERIGNYLLTIDEATYDEFITSFPLSSLSTKLSGCQYQSRAITSEAQRGMTIRLTIDKKNRQIVEIELYTGQKTQLQVSIKPDYSTTVVIYNPQDITRFSDIKQQVLKGFLSNSSGAIGD